MARCLGGAGISVCHQMASRCASTSGRCPQVFRRAAAPGTRRTAVVARIASVERPSLDPGMISWSAEHGRSGVVLTVHAPEQLQDALAQRGDQLTVLMCKSKSCRPCKAFTKKYNALAAQFPDVLMLQIFGDETADTRKLMVGLKVKVTPTFVLYRSGEQAATVTGVSDAKLRRALFDAMVPAELEAHAEAVFELEAEEKELAAAAAAAAAAAVAGAEAPEAQQ